MFDFRPLRREAESSFVLKLAIKAGATICFCVIASEWLGTAAQNGELPKITLVWPESESARTNKSTPPPEAGAGVTLYRNIGIDGVTTSTIPRTFRTPATLSPCGGAAQTAN